MAELSTRELLEGLRSMAAEYSRWRSRDAVSGHYSPLFDMGLVAWSYVGGAGAWRPTEQGRFALLAFEEGRQ